MKRNHTIFLALLTGICLSPGMPGVQGQSLSGNLETYLNSLVDVLPGSSGDQFNPPESAELDTWGDMIGSLMAGDLEGAREQAGQLNYQVTEYEDIMSSPPELFYVVEERDPQSRYWGTYVFHSDPLRPGLVIQAPHPVYDSNTGYQAIFCFRRLGALALFFSGTHRCNHSSFTDCSGSTSVCSGSAEPYRISDNAHNTNSAFQKSTEVVFEQGPDSTVFVQLHGFGKQASDPYLIMSNGTRITPDPDYIQVLMDELYQEDNVLTFKVAHLNPGWNRLLAFSNTQGRFINGSGNPCTQDASACSGRFIHIEQERSRLRADASGWYKMYRALEGTFPARSTVGREPAPRLREASLSLYPNPATDVLCIDAEGPFLYSLVSLSGQCLMESRSESGHAEVDLGKLSPGLYLVRVREAGEIRWGRFVLQ
jgi:hypothetical protein